MTLNWKNVKDFGALGDGTTDDAPAIQSAIDAAKLEKGTVYFPPGTYRVGSEITITQGEFQGCRIEGSNAFGVKIKPLPNLTGTQKIFKFTGGSGSFSNVGIKNITIEANTASNCVGIYIDGQGFGLFENVRLMNLKYGVWLHNQSAGNFSELNQFNHFQFDYCENGIRIEQGSGNDSFHGNDFNDCFMNVGFNQIGVNHISGVLYNSRFRFFMWSHNQGAQYSTYFNCNGNGFGNIGDFTFEGDGKITGTGRFWFNGFTRGTNGHSLIDNTVPNEHWQKTFACDNYWKGEAYGNTGMTAGALPSQTTSFNSPTGFFQSLRKDIVDSVVLNTYNQSDENGLYLGRTGYQQGENQATLGLFLTGSGSKFKSYYNQNFEFDLFKRINYKLGNRDSFRMFTDSMSFGAQTSNNYQFREIGNLYFTNFIAGKVILTTGNMQNQYAASSVFDIHWGINGNSIQNSSKSGAWNGQWTEFIEVYFNYDGGYRKLRVQTNNKNAIEVWVHFVGIIY